MCSYPVSAAPALDDDEVTDNFLSHLLDEINVLRDSAGTSHLTSAPHRANAALDDFLATTAPSVAWPGPCVHQLLDGAFAWDYVRAAGYSGEARGEVLACPGPEPYWTADRVAEQWWMSPGHFRVLYADSETTAIACGVYGMPSGDETQEGSRSKAAMAILCVTFRS